MKQHRQWWMTALVATALSTSAAFVAGFSRPADARVTFHAVGPAGLKIEGTTTDLDVSEDGGDVIVTVALAKLQTGIEIRDRHMKEKYLEVDKYPLAKMVVRRSSLELPAAGQKVSSDAPVTLMLHGQSRPTVAHYAVKSEGPAYAVEGRLHLNMNEMGIAVPVYLGVTVKPDVDVDVRFQISGS